MRGAIPTARQAGWVVRGCRVDGDGVAESTVLAVLVIVRCQLICGDESTGLAVDEMCSDESTGLAVDEMCRIDRLAVDEGGR